MGKSRRNRRISWGKRGLEDKKKAAVARRRKHAGRTALAWWKRRRAELEPRRKHPKLNEGNEPYPKSGYHML